MQQCNDFNTIYIISSIFQDKFWRDNLIKPIKLKTVCLEFLKNLETSILFGVYYSKFLDYSEYSDKFKF